MYFSSFTRAWNLTLNEDTNTKRETRQMNSITELLKQPVALINLNKMDYLLVKFLKTFSLKPNRKGHTERIKKFAEDLRQKIYKKKMNTLCN